MYISLFVPHFLYQKARAQPSSLIALNKRCLDFCPSLAVFGLYPGIRLDAACKLCPQAVVHELSEEALLGYMEELISVCMAFSPDVEVLGTGFILFCESTFRSDALLEALKLNAHLASSASRFTACVAARMESVTIQSGDEASYLATKSIEFLPLSNQAFSRLKSIGIDTLGLLAQLGVQDLASLIGQEASFIQALATGKDAPAFSPLPRQGKIVASTSVEGPIETWQPMLDALKELFEKVYAQLPSDKVPTALVVEWGKLRLEVRLAKPSRNPVTAYKLTAERLVAKTIEVQADTLTLSLTGLIAQGYVQADLFSLTKGNLRQLAERLRYRCNPYALMTCIFDKPAARLPEERGRLQSLVEETVSRPLYEPKPISVETTGLLPTQVKLRDSWQDVSQILATYKLEGGWFRKQAFSRQYYTLSLRSGAYIKIFEEKGVFYRH